MTSPSQPGPAVQNPLLRALVERFAESQCSWLSSVRPDGRAHSVPVWHAWHQGKAYIVVSSHSVKAANILVHPGVVISHPDPMSPVIIEGWAALAPRALAELRPLFQAKYGWDIATDRDYDAIIAITPTRLMAWGEHGEGRWSGDEVGRVWLGRSEQSTV